MPFVSLGSLHALDSEAPVRGLGGELESKVLGAIFDALDSLDSHQGPNLIMHLLTLHVPPQGL